VSWYDSNWLRRWPIAVDKLTAGTAAIDLTIDVPSDLEPLWANCQSNGFDLVLCGADGTTLLTYHRKTWNYSGRAATLEVQSWTPPAADCMALLWLYFEHASDAAADQTASFTASGPRSGYIEASCPRGPRIKVSAEQPGAVRPRRQLSKTSNETILPWFDLGKTLFDRCTKYNGHIVDEEISYVQQQVLKAAADQAGEYDETEIRFHGRDLIRAYVTAGTDGEDRTVRLSVGTTEGRVLDPRFWLKIRDIDEV